MYDLDKARQQWAEDLPRYEAYGAHLKPRIERLLQELGLHGTVECRSKELTSLIGKLILKPDKTYDSLTDKLGLRVILHFRPLCNLVLDSLKQSFNCQNIENKAAVLGNDRVGYLGIHLDLTLLPGDPYAQEFEGLSAEVQVRTLAEHLWADISHQLSYKVYANQDPDFARRIMITSGALELVDREFARLHEELTSRSEYQESVVLNALERQFFRVVAHAYNRELSLEVIHTLMPLYSEAQLGAAHFRTWFEENETLVRTVYAKTDEQFARSPFLYQPEAFMILDLLQHNRFRLRDAWNRRFPEKELERFANYWGRTL